MSEEWTEERLREEYAKERRPERYYLIDRWLNRGDGVAVYQNQDLGHPEVGHRQWVSYGSPAALLETDEPPERLPDIGGAINWRYTLEATCRRPQ